MSSRQKPSILLSNMHLSNVILLLFLPVFVSSSCEKPNVGTVLFTDADNTKQCWTAEGIALLTSRMILEDVLPAPKVLAVSSEEFVGDLIEYFRLVLEVVRQVTYGKTKHVVLLALTDLLGK